MTGKITAPASAAEHQWAPLFEGDVGGAGDKRVGESVGDGRKRSHGTRENDGTRGRVTAAGDARAHIGIGELGGFLRRRVEQLFEQAGATGEAKFFSHDAERIFRGDEVDLGDAVVCFEGAEQLSAEDCAGCAGDGYGEVHKNSF